MKRMWQRRIAGFTMIELLVVVLIIGLLSGMLFKAVSALQQKGNKAGALADIEILSHMISAFNAEYGTYPPTTGLAYEYENRDYQSPTFQTFLKNWNDPNEPGEFFPDADSRLGYGSHWPKATRWKDSLGYRYGLVSFLWPRDQGQGRWGGPGDEVHWYDMDYDSDPDDDMDERDVLVKTGWADMAARINVDRGWVRHESPKGLESLQEYTNSYMTVLDPWGRSYQYECRPPYTRYRLWSTGPDGVNGNGDDIDYETGAGVF